MTNVLAPVAILESFIPTYAMRGAKSTPLNKTHLLLLATMNKMAQKKQK